MPASNLTAIPRSGTSKGVAGHGFRMPQRHEVVVTITGFNVLREHWETIALATYQLCQVSLMYSGIFVTAMAKQIAALHWETGALYGSIGVLRTNGGETGTFAGDPGLIERSGDLMMITIGSGGDSLVASGHKPDPSTGGEADPQARLLEFGFSHVPDGKFIQVPIMIPALDYGADSFIRSAISIGTLPDHFPQNIPPELTSEFSKWRNGLYSFSKAMGDVQVFAGSAFIGKARSASLKAARALGDVNSLMRDAIGQRIQARVVGHFAAAGFTSTFTASVSGPPSQFRSAANRIYNRFVGREFGISMRELSIGR